jgi:hypothetical protein
MSDNGNLLWNVIESQNLYITNVMDICDGIITRHRDTTNGEESSVIDFILMSENLVPFIKEMTIDEEGNFALTNFNHKRSNSDNFITSDHNMLICKLNIECQPKTKEKLQRREIFNFKNIENQQAFKHETDNGNELSSVFNGNGDVHEKTDKWLKVLNKKFHKCFKKIRVTKKQKPNHLQSLLESRSQLKKQASKQKCKIGKNILTTKIKEIESKITEMSAEENAKKIKEQTENLSSLNGGFSTIGMWKVKNRVVSKPRDPPMAKKDSAGNLVTNPELIKKLYLKEYQHRLRS